MTEMLLQKLEEKMMLLLTEVEDLRKEVQRLFHENSNLKFEREAHSRKLQDLLSLLDAVNASEVAHGTPVQPAQPAKPVLIQGMNLVEKEYIQTT